MILNNYNNNLKENKETAMTFHSLTSPHIIVDQFEFNLMDGDHLIVPYYVSDFLDKRYKNAEIGPTFTTIIAFDEDTVTSENVRTVKRTTYAGNYIIDLDLGDDNSIVYAPGVHSFSIRTIQSNGVSSPTKYYKYIVRTPIQNNEIIDLNEISSFEGTLEDFEVHLNTVRRIINATYSVTVNRNQTNKVTSIDIAVDGGYKDYSLNSDLTNKAEKANVTFNENYTIATTATYRWTEQSPWNTVSLSNYITSNALRDVNYKGLTLELQAVVDAAIGNKLALTRLCEAAKGAGARKLILPKNMYIICDYRPNDQEQKDSYVSGGVDNNNKIFGRDDIRLPDEFTLDMNGSTIRMLPAAGKDKFGNTKPWFTGSVLRFGLNHDSHVINGKFIGNWYLSGVIGYNTYYESEHLRMLSNVGSSFCSFENLDVSFSRGYELVTVHGDGEQMGYNASTSEAPKFTAYGYIDYAGNFVEDADKEAGFPHMLHTETKVSLKGTLNYNSGATFRLYKTFCNYGYDKVHRRIARDIFVHYYDENENFIKTVKTEETYPLLMPYGAKYITLSMYGFKEDASYQDNPDHLNGHCNNLTYGIKGHWWRERHPFVWCCVAKNCFIHDTRTTLFDDGAIQFLIDSCIFANIAAGVRDATLTPWMVDLEDTSLSTYSYWFKNCECLYGNTNGVDVVRGYDYSVSKCRNMSFSLGRDSADMFIKDSAVNVSKEHGVLQQRRLLHCTDSIVHSASSNRYRTRHWGANDGNILIRGGYVYYESKTDTNNVYGNVLYDKNI